MAAAIPIAGPPRIAIVSNGFGPHEEAFWQSHSGPPEGVSAVQHPTRSRFHSMVLISFTFSQIVIARAKPHGNLIILTPPFTSSSIIH